MVSEEKTPRMSIPRAANQRARAMARMVTSMREGRGTWWGGGGKEVRLCKGLRACLPKPLLRKEASIDGGESGGNK